MKGTDLKKHKYDVFRLLQIINLDQKVETEGEVKNNILQYIGRMENEELPLGQLDLPFGKEEGIQFLKEIYI